MDNAGQEVCEFSDHTHLWKYFINNKDTSYKEDTDTLEIKRIYGKFFFLFQAHTYEVFWLNLALLKIYCAEKISPQSGM